MDTEQPAPESEVSIESRLAAVFEAPAADTPEAATDAPSENVEGEAESEEQVEETIDFEADDGSVIKLPAAAKEAVLRQSDYTKKTQALANLQAQATDRLQYAEAREQLAAAVIQDVADLRALQGELQKFQSADWASLYDANPGQALRFQQQMRDLEKQVNEKQGTIQQKAAHISKATAEHARFQWEKAEQGARELIGNITPQENIAMAQTIRGLGISEQEFKTRFADPRIIAAVHKAAKWDALQAGKPKAMETAKGAPPVVKPGASTGNQSAATKDKALRARLAKSGDLKDAAALLYTRMR